MLEQCLKECSENASYISEMSQHGLTSCGGQFTTEIVVRKIKQNQPFLKY